MVKVFIDAIIHKRKIRVHFFSIRDNRTINRLCAPLDYGPSRHSKNKDDRYHMWNYESSKKTTY